jgi:RNA polymerase sigma factor (sigma-70 family)
VIPTHPTQGPATTSENTGTFPSTRWTLIAGVQQQDDRELQERALSELCRIYWHPIYVVLRKMNCSPEDAEDLTQELFRRIVRNDSFSRAQQTLGKLRTYLLTSAKRLAAEMWRRKSAVKRGSGLAPISIDDETAELRFRNLPTTEATPESLFDKRWALALLQEVALCMEQDYESQGKREIFEALKPFLAGRPSGQNEEDGYARTADALEISIEALRMRICRLREQFRKKTREEIAATLIRPTEEQVDDEMQCLYAALRQS